MPPSDPFDYHAPNAAQRDFIDANRVAAKAMRDKLLAMPPSRERSLAMTALEESLMWANKAAFAPAAATLLPADPVMRDG